MSEDGADAAERASGLQRSGTIGSSDGPPEPLAWAEEGLRVGGASGHVGRDTMPAAAAAAVKTTGYGVMLASGWCVKRRKGLVNIPMWRRRYIVLTTAGHLIYFKSEKAERHRGWVDLRQAFDLFHGQECDQLPDWPVDRPIGCRIQLEAEERTLYLVAESLSSAGRWHSLLSLLQRYATNRCVHDILHPNGERASQTKKNLAGLTPCASSNFLRLNMLACVEENDRCFDCHLKGTSWACLIRGVFLCMRCAGLHRRLAIDHAGFHCDVRSLELANFTDEELLGLELCGGNIRGVTILECKLPPGFRRPAESNERMLTFMTVKYIENVYSDADTKDVRRSLSLGVGSMTAYAISDGEESQSDDDQ